MSDRTLGGARFDMGRTVSQTFGVIGRNFASILILSLLLQVIGIGLSYVIRFGVVGYTPQMQVGITSVASAIINVVLRSVLLGSVTFIAVNDLSDSRVPFSAALAVGFRTLLPLIGLSLILGLGVGLASILIVVPGIMLFLRWLVAVPVRVIEGSGIGNALSRSAQLTKGYRWALFGLALGYGVLAGLVVYGVALVDGGFLLSAAARAHGDPTAILLEVVSSAVLSAISTSGIAAIYAELRRVKEGASMEQLAAVFG